VAMGFVIVATKGTAKWLADQSIPSESVAKVYEGRPNIVDRLKNDEIALVMNTTEGTQAVSDSRDIRRVALMDKIPYFTTAAASVAAVAAMRARGEGYGVRTLQG
jgi:carbamoyl-phosphate synthase large subunit